MYEMKESGIEWIGQIPKHWEVRKVKYIFTIGRGRVIGTELLADTGYPVYSSQTLHEGLLGFISSYDYDYEQLTWTTDGANAGTVFLRNGKYNCTNVCGTLCPKITNISMLYLKFILEYTAVFYKRADTNGYKIMNNEMANILLLFPPLDEQKKIADFLDKKVSEIENLIDDTKKLIEKYREYKQSIITETVTKGLNSNVEMKESGIEWIGQIPKHWKIKLVKELFYNVNNKNIGVKEKNLLSLSYGKIIQKDIYKNDGLVPANFNNYNIIKYDDIVLRLTDLQNDKKSLRVGHVREKGIITSAYITLRPISNYSTRYYYFLLHFYDICKYFYGLGSGVRQSLSFEEVKKILVLFPPLNEQEEIVKYLDDKCSQIDNIIEEKQLLLEKLEAYKKSLIYEYVTGKKQVENE